MASFYGVVRQGKPIQREKLIRIKKALLGASLHLAPTDTLYIELISYVRKSR